MFHSTEGQIFTATKDEKQHLTVKGLSLLFATCKCLCTHNGSTDDFYVNMASAHLWLLFPFIPIQPGTVIFFFYPQWKQVNDLIFFFLFAFSVSYQRVRWVWKYWESKYLILSRPRGFVSCIVKNAKLDLFYLLFHPLKSKCLVWDDNKRS